MTDRRRRYAQVGIGSRSSMFTQAVVERFAATSEIVALCDVNQTRMDYCNRRYLADSRPAPTYLADQFDRMLREAGPDCVIVSTADAFHHQYIMQAMEHGCDVITEKPMTTDAAKCQAILDTKKRTGRQLTVTFNYRYAPVSSTVKQVILEGRIGKPLSTDFHWFLDRRHGADYFRRWHRRKEFSGGLMVHKATHHFDLINWFLDSRPQTVYAIGSRAFYTPQTADRLGLEPRAARCLKCPAADRCGFNLDLRSSEGFRRLYLEAEHEQGYWRDQCVFSEDIDIEDRMAVSARYASGALLSYSLIAYSPHEGYTMTITGTEGRLELIVSHSFSGKRGGPLGGMSEGASLTVCPLFGEASEVEIPQGVGGHGGGDVPMLKDIFDPDSKSDPLGRAASEVDGAYSILTGIAANRSIASGGPVAIDSLVHV